MYMYIVYLVIPKPLTVGVHICTYSTDHNRSCAVMRQLVSHRAPEDTFKSIVICECSLDGLEL